MSQFDSKTLVCGALAALLTGGEAQAANAETHSAIEAAWVQPPERDRNAIYVELLGAAPWASVNYERRFLNHWAVRAGVGYFVADFCDSCKPFRSLEIPVTGSYLFGSFNHMLELGAGAIVGIDVSPDSIQEQRVGAFPALVLGYRYEVPEDEMVFRAGVTVWIVPALMNRGLFVPVPAPGISLGRIF